MKQRQFQVIIFFPRSLNTSKRQNIVLTQDSTYEELIEKVSSLFRLKVSSIFMCYHLQKGVYTSLIRSNFEKYRATMHFNKLIKVYHKEDAQLVTSQSSQQYSFEKGHKSLIKKPELKEFKPYEIKGDQITSFFADDFHKMTQFLQTLGFDLKQKNVKGVQRSKIVVPITN